MKETSISNGAIHWTDSNCFEMSIEPHIQESNMISITGYDEGFLTIEFADRSWVTITYPVNLVDLAKEIETGLIEYRGWKRESLSTISIKKIMNCISEYLEKIKQAITIQNANTNKFVFKSSIRSITPLIATRTESGT